MNSIKTEVAKRVAGLQALSALIAPLPDELTTIGWLSMEHDDTIELNNYSKDAASRIKNLLPDMEWEAQVSGINLSLKSKTEFTPGYFLRFYNIGG